MESFKLLKDLVNATQQDVDKLVAGNKSAGTRVRFAMQEIKKLSQEVRSDVQNLRKKEKNAE